VSESPYREQDQVIAATASNLRIDAATADALSAFGAAGVEAVLLKGPALSGWYTAHDPARSYADCDLWVRPSDFGLAEQTLARLGFERHVDQSGLPNWWLEHDVSWYRESDGVTIDLHRFLQGVRVDPGDAWETLAASRDTVLVAGHPTPVLSIPARALYVTLHAAHHGEATGGKPILHVERALAAVPDDDWQVAANLAARLHATDSFGAGLRLIPAGAALAERLGLPLTESVEVALRASSPPPVALGIEQLSSAPGLRARARIVARKVVPPPGFIRHWWPPAAANRRMLVVGYLYRPIWLIKHAPAGVRAWRDARKRVNSGRG
jgi:hypothetical protein